MSDNKRTRTVPQARRLALGLLMMIISSILSLLKTASLPEEQVPGGKMQQTNHEINHGDIEGAAWAPVTTLSESSINRDLPELPQPDDQHEQEHESLHSRQPQQLQQERPQQPPQPILRYDSSDATVIAMAQGYDLLVHQIYVGSLRKTGFNGTIILAVEPENQMKPGVRDYLHAQNVTLATIQYVECNQKIFEDHEVTGKKQKEGNTCIAPYPDVKIRWGRYPFIRDALKACKQCTGPVLMSDARDTFFQRDPFGDGVPDIPTSRPLQFFAEHWSITAQHWFVAYRVRHCKNGFQMYGPQLCSGTTIGTRQAMLEYLEIMYEEMKVWTVTPSCFFKSHGGDQAIMNYLYYSGKFDSLAPQVFRPRDGIVNTVGALGLRISKGMASDAKRLNLTNPFNREFQGANKKDKTWIGTHFDITDNDGYFIQNDGTRSRVIHQWDRFGVNLGNWLKTRSTEIYL